jgi:hypothetical protein
VEALEERTLLHMPFPQPVIPQATVDKQVAPALMNNLPKIANSLGGASNIPILGTALAKSLTTDHLMNNLVNDVLKNLRELPTPDQDPNPDPSQYENYTDALSGNVLSLTVDTVHEQATETVPLTLPLGSFLSLSNPLPQVSVQIDIYYAMAAQITLDPKNPFGPPLSTVIVDSDLTQNFQKFPGVSLPTTSMAIIEKATLLPNSSAKGMLNGLLPISFTDHDPANPVSNFQGTIQLKFGTFDSLTGTPNPAGFIDGTARFDADATTQFADPQQVAGLPFNPIFKTELVAQWKIDHKQYPTAPSAPLGTLNDLELQNVQVDMGSLSSLAGLFVQKIQGVIDASSLRKFRNTMDTEVPLLNIKLRDLTQQLGFISAAGNNFLSALDAIDAINAQSASASGFAKLGSYKVSDPRPSNFTVSAEGDVPPAGDLDLVNQLKQALGLASGSAADIGLDFPLLTDPGTILPVLFSLAADAPNTTDVNLVTFHLPSLDFTMGSSLPVYIPGLPIVGGVGLQGHIDFHLQADLGYDTAGLRELVTEPRHNPQDLLDGLYTIPANTQVSAQGRLTLSAGIGVFAQGGLYASLQMQPDGMPEPGTGKVHIGGAVDDPGCFFTGGGKIYEEADVGAGATLPVFGGVGFSFTLGHKDLFVFERDCDTLSGNPIRPTDNHILLLDTSRMGESNLGSPLDPPEIRVHTFERKLIFPDDPDLYSGIEVDYPGSSDLYIERDSAGNYKGSYYDVIATNAPTPLSGIIDITNPFGEADLPSGDTPMVLLFGSAHDDTFVYHNDTSVTVQPRVLLVGEGGDNKLSGADLAFAGYIPTTPAALATQAQSYVPANGPGLSSDDQAAQAVIATQLQNAISDTAATGRSVLTGTHTSTLVGGAGFNSFDETGGGDYQFYGGTGGNNFTVRPSVDGGHSTYVIHGAGDPANNLLTVIQGDDATVQAGSLAVNVRAASVADETNPGKKALAVDDGTQPPFVTAHDIGKFMVEAVSSTIPVTTGIGKLTGTTIENVAYNLPTGANHPSNKLRLLGTDAADTFNVDENDADVPTFFFTGNHTNVHEDVNPVATQVSVTYGDDQTAAHFTLVGLQAADHLALAGGLGRDTYSVTLSAGTYFTTDIEDTDQTSGSGPAGGNDVTIIGVRGSLVRQDKITVNDNSAAFAYHLARLPNLYQFEGYGVPVYNLDIFRQAYRTIIFSPNLFGLDIKPDVSNAVFYSPTVTWGSGIKNVGIDSFGTFSQVEVNRPTGGSDVTLTMAPSSIGAQDILTSQIAAYTDRHFPPPNSPEPVELLDPRAVVDITANAGNFTFEDQVGGSTVNVHANSGTFTLAGTSTGPTASAVVKADVAAGAGLSDTVNILANSGTVNLNHKGVGLTSSDYVQHPEQINLGTGGSLASIQGTLSLQTSGELAAVTIDDSKNRGAGVAWTVGQTGISSPTFSFQLPAASTPANSSLASLTLNVNVGSSVHVTGIPSVYPPGSVTVNGVDQNNALQGPDASNTWQIAGPDSGVLNDPLNYTGFNNLTGGGLDDTFVFQNGGSVSGTLDGGPGIDALDYRAYTPPPVHVDLSANHDQATAVAGGTPGAVRNVETAFLFSLSPLNNIPTIREGVQIPSVQVPTNNPFAETLTYSDLVNGQHTLPAGLSIDPTSGVISGTPGPGAAAGSPYSVTVTVTDGLATKGLVFSWAVSPAVTIIPPGPQSSGVGATITPLQIQATNALGGTLTYSDLVNGQHTLPPGLSIASSGNGAGLISGTLTNTADRGSPYSVTITASDGTYSASTIFGWVVSPLYLLTPFLGNGQSALVNTSYAPFGVKLTDASGKPVPFVQVNFVAPFNPTGAPFHEPSGAFGGSSPFSAGVTDMNGLAIPFNLPFVANAFAGSFIVQAQASIGLGPATGFRLTNLPAIVPIVSLTPPQFTMATQSASYGLSAVVPITVIKPTYRIDWGDGTPNAPDIQLIPVPSSNGGAFSVLHVYALPTTYQPSVQIVDGSGATVVSGLSPTVGIVPVNSDNLQLLLDSAPANPVEFDVTADTDAQTFVAAVNGLHRATKIPVKLALAPTPVGHEYVDMKVKAQPHQPVQIHGKKISGFPRVKVVGHSPALEVDEGDVTVDGIDFTTATGDPVVQVNGGSLTARDITITATGSSTAAVQVTGGTVDLGAAGDPGNNVLDIEGPGNLIENTSGNPISAVGDTFEVGGVPLTSNYRIADRILDGRDAGGAGLVTFVPGNIYVTAQSGSIQRAIDAVPDGTTIHVESAVYPPYDTHGRNVSILFTTTINAGTYSGSYTVSGQGSFTGPTTVELALGVYTVDDGAGLGGGSSFDFQVDALGSVTTLDPLAAVGGLGTLTFRTAGVAINPGDYAGGYTLSPFGSTVFTGPHTFNLITGLYYTFGNTAGGAFAFALDNAGNVAAVSSSAATGEGSTLDVTTIPLMVDPGGYTGPYTMGGSLVSGGPATVSVIAALATPVTVGGQSGMITVDDSGVTPDTLPFTVSGQAYTFHFAANRAPTASAGGPYTLTEGDPLTLNASASSDPDHDSLTYSWDLNGDGVFGDATGVSPMLTWAQLNALAIDDGPGTFFIRVQVDDGHGHVVSSGTNVTVSNAPPTVGVSGLANVAFGQSVAGTLSALDPSPADQAAGFAYTVDWGDGSAVQQLPAAPGNGNSMPVTHFFPGPGSYTIQVTATDKDGGLSSPAVQKVTVAKADDAVNVMASPAPSTFGKLVTFTASATADVSKLGIPTGTVTFYDGSISLGTVPLTNGAAIYSTSSLTAGPHTITAVTSGDAIFQAGTVTATVDVQKATPTITWADSADIVYGTALGADQLNATADVPGTFAYNPAPGLVLHAGNGQVLSAAFTPDDTADYTSAGATVSLNVLPAGLTVTADDKAITYGDGLPAFTVSYAGFVNGDTSGSLIGSLSFSGSATTAVDIGAYAIIPGGLTSADYAITFGKGKLTVAPALLTVTADNAWRFQGQTNPTFTGTITGIQNGDVITAVYSSPADQSSPPGFYDINAGLSGAQLANYTVTINKGTLEIVQPSSLSGLVFADVNNNGQVDFGEPGIGGVTIRLQGTDDLSQTIDRNLTTDADGTYAFGLLRRGSYTITETQAAGYAQGINTVGTAGGTAVGDQFFINLGRGVDGMNYNFGEQPATTVVHPGQTAQIGFWHNSNGQTLIRSLNGGGASGHGAHALGDWLATTFANMYGALLGVDNAGVASYFQNLFAQSGGPKLDAQVMATALSVYVTTQSLAGNTAAAYGFEVTAGGLGATTFNVGSSGAAFDVADNSVLTVMDLLRATNRKSTNGKLYGLYSGSTYTHLRNLANTLYGNLNQAGTIG